MVDKAEKVSEPILNYVIVPNEEGGAPDAVECSDSKQFRKSLYGALISASSGWAYVYVNGKRCALSKPMQIFQLKLPDGQIVELREDEPEYPEDGRFRCLVAVEK